MNYSRIALFPFAMLVSISLLNATPSHAQPPQKNKVKSSMSSVTVFAAGDIADCRKQPAHETMAEQTARLVEQELAKDSKAMVITLGDNTYPIGKIEEFHDCYEPTWGRFKARTLPSPGNHDYGVPLAQGYYNYFDELAGPDRRGYYKKTLGAWQVYSLNSNLKNEAMQTQLGWLEKELQQAEGKAKSNSCILAFWHHPVFASGGHGNNQTMIPAWKLLEKYQADLILAGHEHDYERLAPLTSKGERDEQEGIRSFVVGTGGVKLTPMFFPKAITDVRNNSNHGVLKLKLHANSYEWEFLTVNGDGFTDKGQAQCH